MALLYLANNPDVEPISVSRSTTAESQYNHDMHRPTDFIIPLSVCLWWACLLRHHEPASRFSWYLLQCHDTIVAHPRTVHIPGQNPYKECDIRACARFRGEWGVATSHPENIYSTTTEQTTYNRFLRVLMNSISFNVKHYHNTHSTQYRFTHYTLLLTVRCFQSV
jgi:hypothetical protein